MRVKRDQLEQAAREGLLQPSQVEPLWTFLASQSGFNFVYLAYFLGALLIIGAFSFFMVNAWEVLNAWVQTGLSLAWALGLGWLGLRLWRRPHLAMPGGLLVTCAVAIVPLVIYSLQRGLGIWGGHAPGEFHDFHVWIRGGWVWMEVGTIAVGAVALRYVRFPFLTFPIAFVLWYMSMDLTPILFGAEFTWERRKQVSLVFGLIMLIVAFAIDRRFREDFAFWLYLFGLAAFWGGLSLMDSGSEWGKLFYLLINLLLLAAGTLLQRRVFLVFGSAGVFAYLGHLAWSVFENEILFSFALALAGLALIFTGIQVRKHQAQIEAFVLGLIPAGARRWLPRER